MSIVAIVPVASMTAANASLALAGFGSGNFSVPCYGGTGITHAALHAWNAPVFASAVKAQPGVVWEESAGDPVLRTQALIEAQGAKWGAQSPELPSTGTVIAGSLYRLEDALWSIIQSFDRSTFGAHPDTYPALIRRLRDPYKAEPWRQPLDQFDSYQLVNPFTGNPDRCTHAGQTWVVTQADGGGNNVWEPGAFGWAVQP